MFSVLSALKSAFSPLSHEEHRWCFDEGCENQVPRPGMQMQRKMPKTVPPPLCFPSQTCSVRGLMTKQKADPEMLQCRAGKDSPG